MIPPESIKRANVVLRDLDALFPGDNTYQKFKWSWSSDLWALVPALDGNGDQRFEFICQCGTDVRVHSASCDRLTEARVVMEKAYMCDPFGPLESYPNLWVLCRWNPPPPLAMWRSSMGTDVDYPANGRYLPVDKGGIPVVIPPRAAPTEHEPISHLVVRMMRAHIEKLREEESKKEIKRELPRLDAKGNMIEEPHKGARFWQVRDRIHDARPRFDLTATVGYGGKTGRGDKPATVHRSDRSLADPDGALAREMQRPVEELRHALEQRRKELENASSR